MSRWWKYAIVLLVALIAAALAFSAFLRAYVVGPAATMLWAGWRVVASVDQRVYWLLLVVLCSLLIIRVFSLRGGEAPSATEPGIPTPRTRVEYWRTLFSNAAHSPDAQAALRLALRDLQAAGMRRAPHGPDGELQALLAERGLHLPADIAALLSAEGAERPRSRIAHVRGRLRDRIGRRPAFNDQAIERTLRWMEETMETSHDQ